MRGLQRASTCSPSSPKRTTTRRRSEPTWGAASPTPRASAMMAAIRSASSAQGLVELRDLERGRAQHGVAELADLVERGEPPALEDGVVECA